MELIKHRGQFVGIHFIKADGTLRKIVGKVVPCRHPKTHVLIREYPQSNPDHKYTLVPLKKISRVFANGSTTVFLGVR